MRNLYLWNKVFKRVMEIKDEYLKDYEDIDYLNYPSDSNILREMVSKLKDDIKKKEYSDWLNTLKITQNGCRILLHYDLLASAHEMWNDINSINIEARSIYIDLDKEDIILCPMPKFFNIDEIPENKSDIIFEKIKKVNMFEVSDKLDGSNQNATFYDGKIILCGSTACDPNKSWRIVEGYKLMDNNIGYFNMLRDNPNKIFIFEFIHPEDNHIVYYNENKTGLYLLCIRDNFTGEISSYKDANLIAKKYGILFVDIENYSLEELLSLRDKFSANDKEGWVLNIDGYRVKFKTEDYLKMHKCLSNKSVSKILIQEIANNTFDDFISCVPLSSKEKILNLSEEIFSYINNEKARIYKLYEDIKDIENNKDFAFKVQEVIPKEYRSFIFELRQGKPLNVLKKGKRYLKPHEIGIKNIYLKFSEIDTNMSDDEEEP